MVRQGCASVKQYELLPCPPPKRESNNPWPEWPRTWRSSSAHDECEARDYSIETVKLEGRDGKLEKLHARRLNWVAGPDGRPKPEPVAGSEFEAPCDLLLLAMGFVGAERNGLVAELGVKLNERGNLATDENKMTSVPGVFAAGDIARGQSLIVWAIAEGRAAAQRVDAFLMGESVLPSPLAAGYRPI